MDNVDVIVRAEQAERLLNDETLQAAFKAIREKIFRDWGASGHTDIEAREQLWLMGRLMDELETMLHNYVSYGTLEKEAQKQKSMYESMKDMFRG